ncbi:MAG: TrkH family potassium uptake protein [Deltaproteobacteria bacterium]|nr:TrkH family potassium uptake protein [Candidatus Anaeroferrophillacea bacterium]
MIRHVKERLFIFNYLGALLTIFGLLLFLPLAVQLWFAPDLTSTRLLAAFVLPALGLVVGGLTLQKKVPGRIPTVREGMIITALAWMTAALVSSLPFVIALGTSLPDAVFEATSGITASGLTVFTGLDRLPAAILFWRSLLQWIGGIGILTFFLAVSFRGGTATAALFGAEGHKITSRRLVPGIFNTVKIIWLLYGGLTIACFFCLYALGMNLFDALNHALTLVSTGGFSTHDASIAHYAGTPRAILLEYCIMFFMVLGGINFLIHYKVVKGDWRVLYRDYEIRWFWGLLAGAALFVAVDHLRHLAPLPPDLAELYRVCRTCLFQVISVLTSTGYATEPIHSPFYPACSRLVFMLLLFVGGAAGSTAGGFKLLRLGILWRVFTGELRRAVAPRRAVQPLVIHGQIIDAAEIRRVTALLFAWLLLVFAGAGVTLLLSDLDPWQACSGMLSAVSNMGPHYFSVSIMAGLHPVIKVVFSLGMLVGRIEILPFLVLFSRSAWR